MNDLPIAGAWDHTSLAVGDLDAALAFYTEAFGYEVVSKHRDVTDPVDRMMGTPGLRCDLAELRAPDGAHMLELIAFDQDPAAQEVHMTRAGAAHVGFCVENLDAAMQRVVGLGAELVGEPVLYPGGRVVFGREPSGTAFELYQKDSE